MLQVWKINTTNEKSNRIEFFRFEILYNSSKHLIYRGLLKSFLYAWSLLSFSYIKKDKLWILFSLKPTQLL